MDTLSSSVSTLKGPGLHSTPREFYLFKTPNTTHQLPPFSSTTKPNSISNKTTSFTHKNLTSPLFYSSQTLSHKSSPHIHRNPASGYAAALLDIAQCKCSLEAVQKDVKSLSKLLQNEKIQAFLIDPFVGEREKGQVVKEVAKGRMFNRHLLGLLKILIEKNKVGIVREVLMEFERIYDALSGTRVVLVSSARKMEG